METDSPYHEGERSVQERAGVRDAADQVAGMVRSSVTENMQAFLSRQPFAIVTSSDRERNVWVSLLTGEPGFIRTTDSGRVRLDTNLPTGDPLASHRRERMYVGTLLIDPRDRSRLRLNGVASTVTKAHITLQVEEVYPNCQKYIQRRSFDRVDDRPANGSPINRTDGLTESQREWIRTADTFFIGTEHPDVGADASHRGGNPGFITVKGDTLVVPDYPGNNMFCTLGNIAADGRAGLLFVDFESGRTLQTTGTAEVVWDDHRVAAYDRAERLVEITVAEAVESPDGNPLRWTLEERSPFNP